MKWGVLWVCLWVPLISFAQDVADLQVGQNGIYTLKIDSEKYVAIKEAEYYEMVKVINALKEQLSAANIKIKGYKANSDAYEENRKKYIALTAGYKKQTEEMTRLNVKYLDTSEKLIALNNEYSKTLKSFDALVEKYRDVALRSSPRNPVDVGLGVLTVNDIQHNVFMFGAGTDVFGLNFRGWLYGGQDTYGAMVGMSF